MSTPASHSFSSDIYRPDGTKRGGAGSKKHPNQFHKTVNEFNENFPSFSVSCHQKKFTPHTARRPSNSVVIAVHQSVATAVSIQPEEKRVADADQHPVDLLSQNKTDPDCCQLLFSSAASVMHTSGYLLLFRRQETAEDGTDVKNSSTHNKSRRTKRKQKKQKSHLFTTFMGPWMEEQVNGWTRQKGSGGSSRSTHLRRPLNDTNSNCWALEI